MGLVCFLSAEPAEGRGTFGKERLYFGSVHLYRELRQRFLSFQRYLRFSKSKSWYKGVDDR